MTPNPIASLDRLHALDAFRASMMLLGVVLHGAVSYGPTDVGSAWPVQDPNTHFAWDLVVAFIHVFRMPAFFVMAGFFTALLVERRGVASMVRNRGLRIALPFALFWPPLFVLTRLGGDFAFFMRDGDVFDAAASAWQRRTELGWFSDPSTNHLWFLWYLLHLYVLAVLGYGVSRLASSRVRGRITRFLDAAALGRARLLVLGTLTSLSLLTMSSSGLDTDASFSISANVFAAYVVFFGFGWLLWLRRDRLRSFTSSTHWNLTLGPVLLGAAGWLRDWHPRTEDPTLQTLSTLLLGFATWHLVFGFLGVFLRHGEKPSRSARYLVDASYWIYLIHLPLCVWLPGLLRNWDVSAFVKAPLMIVAVTALGIATYHACVRSTWLGVMLSGRRYSAPIPGIRPASAPDG